MTNEYVEAETRDRLAALRAENERLAAEVARLTALVGEARRLIEQYAIDKNPDAENWIWCKACTHWVFQGDAHAVDCPIAAFLATTKGATDAAT